MDTVDTVDQQEASEASDALLNTALASVEAPAAPAVSLDTETATASAAPVATPAPEVQTKPLSSVRTFDDPQFWDAFNNTINKCIDEKRIPKFFAVSETAAPKFLQVALAKFPDFATKEIKSVNDISFNIISKDEQTKFTIFVMSSAFVVDPVGQDGGQFF